MRLSEDKKGTNHANVKQNEMRFLQTNSVKVIEHSICEKRTHLNQIFSSLLVT